MTDHGNETLKAIIDKLQQAQRTKNAAKSHEVERVRLNKLYAQQIADAQEMMEAADCSLLRFNVDEDSFSASSRTTSSATIGDELLFEHWCRSHGIDLGQFKAYNSNKLSAYYREALKNDKPIPAGLETKEHTQLIIRKA